MCLSCKLTCMQHTTYQTGLIEFVTGWSNINTVKTHLILLHTIQICMWPKLNFNALRKKEGYAQLQNTHTSFAGILVMAYIYQNVRKNFMQFVFFFSGGGAVALRANVGHGLLILEVSRSARRRDLYITTHNTHNRQTSMPPVGFEPVISTGEWPQTYALDRATTGTGVTCM